MAIIKKINNKNVVYANKGVKDHNLLMGRDSYAAHPMTAILGLGDELNTIKNNISINSGNISSLNTKVGRIQLVDNHNSSFTFTNGENESTTISFANQFASDVIHNSNGVLSVKALKDDEHTISISNLVEMSNSISSNLTSANGYTDEKISELESELNAKIDLLDGQGGYLTPYNFGSSVTQSDLTSYALQELNLSDSREIPNLIRVKNTANNNVWVLTNSASTFKWTNEGVDSIEIATTDTYGVVRSSANDYEGSVDSLGHITINGLEEKLNDLENEIGTLETSLSSVNKIVVASSKVVSDVNIPDLTANNINLLYSNFENSKVFLIDYRVGSEKYLLRANSFLNNTNNIVMTIYFNDAEKDYLVRYNLNKNTSEVEVSVKEI